MTVDYLSITLAERPKDVIVPGQTFRQKRNPALRASSLTEEEILVEVLYLAIDPAMRGWVSAQRSYLPPVAIGSTMRGFSACRVIATKSKLAKVGDYVYGETGWAEYAVLPEEKFVPAADFPGLEQPQDMLSILGLTGMTAWWGMTQIGEPKPGELVVVSGAAGATGSIAGQIAKLKGARVVGICGSDEKCDWVTEQLGFDVALNYKADDFQSRFQEVTKDYIDVYYDNVGGEILDMCLAQAKPRARFVMCGSVSQYNTRNPYGQQKMGQVVSMRIRMQGFIIFDHQDCWSQARRELSEWRAKGLLKSEETIVNGGLAAAETALGELFSGGNKGKLIVKVKDE